MCGTGGEGNAFIVAMKEGGPYVVEAAMFPEAVGYECINMAVKLFNNEKVPEHWVTPTFALTQSTWNKYYDSEGRGADHQLGGRERDQARVQVR